MLDLPAGIHTAPKAGLRFHLAASLSLPEGSLLLLCGENGAGKSTFLENVLIPAVRSRHCILYLAQDMDLQRNTMAATLALMNVTVPCDLQSLALAWIRAGSCKDVIILDEFDKYRDTSCPKILDLSGFRHVVMVTHLELGERMHGFSHCFRLHFIRERSGADVHLHLEQSW